MTNTDVSIGPAMTMPTQNQDARELIAQVIRRRIRLMPDTQRPTEYVHSIAPALAETVHTTLTDNGWTGPKHTEVVELITHHIQQKGASLTYGDDLTTFAYAVGRSAARAIMPALIEIGWTQRQ